MIESGLKSILTLDLGGTNIKAALVTPEGRLEYFGSYATLAERGPAKLIDRMVSIVEDIVIKNKLELDKMPVIAIAAAGILDINNGIVTASPSLPGWRNIRLREILSEKLGVNIHLINDASAAALGEHRLGAGKGLKNLIYLTVSTGIGGGIIINNELYTGTDGCAGELGHMIVETNGPECNCGSFGCLEIMASGTALASETVKRIKDGEISQVMDMVNGITENITAEKVALAARRGDPLACSMVNRVAFYLGIGMSNIINIFNPEMIIIGGGLSKMGEMLLRPARKVVRERALRFPSRNTRIVRARLGDNAGTIGAALSAFGNTI
jgi:glucokinase